jgi:hypothetical protein
MKKIARVLLCPRVTYTLRSQYKYRRYLKKRLFILMSDLCLQVSKIQLKQNITCGHLPATSTNKAAMHTRSV